ncbi:unnamed protein product [Schistocephalus solidus]|uniref:Uncharacterized protein n=1 Tax=Schistocephalus solidus TaxID=70667 RepID=A0A183SL46_SCHSO|nr:unnamed protein product [Schistocephalus solidus]
MERQATTADWRSCGHNYAFDEVIIPDRVPVPKLLDSASLGSPIMTFWACPETPISQESLALGIFALLRIQFGVFDASQTFQRTNGREIHQLGYISQSESYIQHRDSPHNEVTDTLTGSSIANFQFSP